ncbi:MAG TPA: hypothetical protein ENI42_04935, partial [Thermoplasmatales archaeon]|nr:hypothetical protein [Thermoplasmatales archaeon]
MKPTKPLTCIIVLTILSLSLSPIITNAKFLPKDKPFSKKANTPFQINKEVIKTVSNNPPTISKPPSMIPRYLYLYTNYGGFQQWMKIDRFNYILQKLRNKGIQVDINNDEKNDLIIKPTLKPRLLKEKKLSIAYETKMTITKIPTNNLDNKFFETKLYFFPPKFFSNKLSTIGYRSPEGEQIPESCTVTKTFITQLIPKKQKTHTTLHYKCTNPSTKVILLSGETSGNTNNTSGWTAVEAGHISLGGNIHMEINGSFEVEGQEIILRGTFDLTTPHNTIDIWWNTTKGFFKINGTGYFTASNIYFNADNKIEFKTKSLTLDAGGHLIIDNSGAEGDLSIDGAFEVEDLSFNIDIHKETITFTGDFDLSSTGEANNLNIA